MLRFNRTLLFTTLVCAAATFSGAAQAAITGYVATNTNLRAGPGAEYPLIGVVRNGARVKIYGCIEQWDWCDVKAGSYRGWIAGDYVQTLYNKRRVALVQSTQYVDVPVIQFNIGTYWDSNYRNRNFYRDRARYEQQERREDRRDDPRDDRHDDRRDDHNDWNNHGRNERGGMPWKH